MNGVTVTPDAPARVGPPADDRFTAKLKDLRSNAAFGINVDDVLTAESK